MEKKETMRNHKNIKAAEELLSYCESLLAEVNHVYSIDEDGMWWAQDETVNQFFNPPVVISIAGKLVAFDNCEPIYSTIIDCLKMIIERS